MRKQQLVDWGTGGREFESRRSDQSFQELRKIKRPKIFPEIDDGKTVGRKQQGVKIAMLFTPPSRQLPSVMVMPGGLLCRSRTARRFAECIARARPARPVVRLALRKARAAGCDEQREHQNKLYRGHRFSSVILVHKQLPEERFVSTAYASPGNGIKPTPLPPQLRGR